MGNLTLSVCYIGEIGRKREQMCAAAAEREGG